MKKFIRTIVFVTVVAASNLFYINIANAQGPNINIPDTNFRAYLVANFDANLDGNIDSTEAANVTGTINVSSSSIADLTGIEAFTAITYLNCAGNNLTSLNVSANRALDTLYCNFNGLTSLNVSGITTLTLLHCYNNLLTSLDISSDTSLVFLNCYNNQLTSLDLSANTALNKLYCFNNQLTGLNITANVDLSVLYCDNNQLTNLNVSGNTSLINLGCNSNQLTGLNVSANTVLTILYCDNNQLTNLNVQNGNNTNVTYFDSRNNPNLVCIQVDNPSYSNAASNWHKDSGVVYSTNCSVGIENYYSENKVVIYPNPIVNSASILFSIPGTRKASLQIFDVSGRRVATLADKIFDAGVNEINWNSSEVNAGIYFLQFQTAGDFQSHKLIVTKN
jgi:hypothetical protein